MERKEIKEKKWRCKIWHHHVFNTLHRYTRFVVMQMQKSVFQILSIVIFCAPCYCFLSGELAKTLCTCVSVVQWFIILHGEISFLYSIISWCVDLLISYFVSFLRLTPHAVASVYLLFTSSDDMQPSTLITDQSPIRLLLDIKGQEYVQVLTPYT